MVEFTANTVVVDDDDPDFILVGFTDGQEGSCREPLMFQRSYEFDEQDVALGLKNVYVERNGQAQSAYGVIRQFVLQRDQALLQVEGKTASRLEDSDFRIRFGLDDGEFANLRRGLRMTFEDFDCFVDCSQ